MFVAMANLDHMFGTISAIDFENGVEDPERPTWEPLKALMMFSSWRYVF